MEKNRDLQQERGLYQLGLVLFFLAAVLKLLSLFCELKVYKLPCIVNKLTGYYCPGCGGTRACMALFKGNVVRSFCCHPVVPYAAALYVWFMITHTVEYVSKGKIKAGMRYSDKYLKGALWIILFQWIIKNLLKAVWGIAWI